MDYPSTHITFLSGELEDYLQSERIYRRFLEEARHLSLF
jgi:hypothetical protein